MDGKCSRPQVDPKLSKIPVVVFTTSEASSDVLGSYEREPTALRKPGNLPTTLRQFSPWDFWLGLPAYPGDDERSSNRVLLIEDNPVMLTWSACELVERKSRWTLIVQRLSDGLLSLDKDPQWFYPT
jgi:hypothetical protein